MKSIIILFYIIVLLVLNSVKYAQCTYTFLIYLKMIVESGMVHFKVHNKMCISTLSTPYIFEYGL